MARAESRADRGRGGHVPHFEHEGLRLHYVEHGDGPPLVLVHGLLWSSRMFVRLRRELPGQRVILLNVRGHGDSDRPTDPSAYSWAAFARDVIALLDHLRLERAIVGGLSLGANVALETGMTAPERCAGLVVEMPVLGRGRVASKVVFHTAAAMLDAARYPLRLSAPLVGRLPLPAAVPDLVALRDVLSADPVAGAALMRGLLRLDELPDDDPERLRRLTMPTLVIGHHGDPMHAIDDSRDLAERLPRARLVEARSILDFRLDVRTLAAHVRALADEAWG